MKAIERIYQYIDYQKIKPAEFERICGISNGYLSKQINRRADIGESILCNILEKCREINPTWLLIGEGTMLRDENKADTIEIASNKLSSTAIPFYNLPVSAGPLGILTYSQNKIKPDGYIDIEAFRRCDAILPVIGISMEPEIHSGDLIGIKKMDYHNWEYIQTGKIYMIITYEDRMIKYISKADDSEYIICSSPNYYDFKVRKDDILEVYRVIASVKSF